MYFVAKLQQGFVDVAINVLGIDSIPKLFVREGYNFQFGTQHLLEYAIPLEVIQVFHVMHSTIIL